MLSTYTNTNQTMDTAGVLSFNINKILTGCAMSHTAGSTTVELKKSGYYLITFNATASATATATDPIEVQIYNGDTAIPDAVASSLSTAANSPENLSITTIVKVLPSCQAIDNTASITVQNIGITALYSDVSLTVTRLA